MSNKIHWEIPEHAPALAGERLTLEFDDAEFETIESAIEQAGVEPEQFIIKADEWGETYTDHRNQAVAEHGPRYVPVDGNKETLAKVEKQTLENHIKVFAEYYVGDEYPTMEVFA